MEVISIESTKKTPSVELNANNGITHDIGISESDPTTATAMAVGSSAVAAGRNEIPAAQNRLAVELDRATRATTLRSRSGSRALASGTERGPYIHDTCRRVDPHPTATATPNSSR